MPLWPTLELHKMASFHLAMISRFLLHKPRAQPRRHHLAGPWLYTARAMPHAMHGCKSDGMPGHLGCMAVENRVPPWQKDCLERGVSPSHGAPQRPRKRHQKVSSHIAAASQARCSEAAMARQRMLWNVVPAWARWRSIAAD